MKLGGGGGGGHATAIPAFPPDDEMKRAAPSLASVEVMCPIPLSLNEPQGCNASIFAQTCECVSRGDMNAR
jgi:hypothetical protein